MPTRGFYGHAVSDPDEPCFLWDGSSRSRGEVLERVHRIANGLRRLGLGPRDHLCLLVGNRPEFMEIVLASGLSGTLLTAVNHHLTAEEVAYIVADCDAPVFLCDARFADLGMAAAARAPALHTTIAVGGAIEGCLGFEEWLASQSSGEPSDIVAGGQMLYSSGTTGMPKGVERLPYADDVDENLRIAEVLRSQFPARDGGAWLATGPLYHAAPYGFTLAALHRGATIVIHERFDAGATLDDIERHRVDSLHLVPTMFARLLALDPVRRAAFDPSSLEMVLHGAAPCPPSVKHAMIQWWGEVIWEYYGATEGGLTLASSREWLERPGTVGRALPFWEVMAVDDEGRQVDPGTPGTIYFRSKTGRTFSYYKDPEKTARVHLADDLFTLGDVGHVDEEGYVFVTDRVADVIISGGVNIYPAEVEACLHAHPAITDVAVVGVPSEEWGEEVRAAVELADGYAASPELAAEIIAFARQRIAAFKCPRSVDFMDHLPRTDAGKLYKRRLREGYWAGTGRAI